MINHLKYRLDYPANRRSRSVRDSEIELIEKLVLQPLACGLAAFGRSSRSYFGPPYLCIAITECDGTWCYALGPSALAAWNNSRNFR